jgi:hypothetical protein
MKVLILKAQVTLNACPPLVSPPSEWARNAGGMSASAATYPLLRLARHIARVPVQSLRARTRQVDSFHLKAISLLSERCAAPRVLSIWNRSIPDARSAACHLIAGGCSGHTPVGWLEGLVDPAVATGVDGLTRSQARVSSRRLALRLGIAGLDVTLSEPRSGGAQSKLHLVPTALLGPVERFVGTLKRAMQPLAGQEQAHVQACRLPRPAGHQVVPGGLSERDAQPLGQRQATCSYASNRTCPALRNICSRRRAARRAAAETGIRSDIG